MLFTILLIVLIFGAGGGGLALRTAGGVFSMLLYIVACFAMLGLAFRLLG